MASFYSFETYAKPVQSKENLKSSVDLSQTENIKNRNIKNDSDSNLEKKQIHNSKLETMMKNEVINSSPVDKEELSELGEARSYFYPYEGAITLRFGGNHDFANPNDEKDDQSSGHFGFLYMLESKSRDHTELGFDLFPKREEFLIHTAWKRVFLMNQSFRPNFKLGAALKLDSGDKFNTPLKSENYFILTGLGFEDILKDPISLRLDLDLFSSKKNSLFAVSFGFSYGF